MEHVYLFIGTQKSGTSSLYNILKEHPQINIANQKETKFFYDLDSYNKGIQYFEQQYFKAFDGLPYLDIDPDYMYFEDVPERIFKSLGAKVKFIVTLRDPAIRAYSQYVMEVYRNTEKLSFQESIAQEKYRINNSEGNMYHSYIQRGLYSEQLSRYFNYFPIENFKFFVFEKDFLVDRKKMCDEICKFMNVKPISYKNLDVQRNPRRKVKSKILNRLTRQNKIYNILTEKMLPKYMGEKIRNYFLTINTSQDNIQVLSDVEKKQLTDHYFIEDILKLEELLTINLDHWK